MGTARLGSSSCVGRPKRKPALLPEQRQTAEEETYEQKQEHLTGHTTPRSLQGVEENVFFPKKNRMR
jgi:hypothetical protein